MGGQSKTYEYRFKIALRRTIKNQGILVKSTLTLTNIPFVLPVNAPNEYVANIVEQYCAHHYKEWSLAQYSTTF